jgi:hypothetical protein
MSYRIVYPVAMPIDAKDFGEAVKKFVKLNHFMNIEQLILTDQYNHMKANISYYKKNNHRKASIELFPIDTAAVAAFPGVIGFPGVTGFSSTDPKTPYPSFAVGPSMLGGPAGIIAPAGPLMVERAAMIGGPVIGGPIIGGPVIGGPIIGPPGGTVLFGARPAPTSSGPSEDIIRINNEKKLFTATTKDGSTFPIVKIEKIRDNEYKVSGPSGKISLIKTQIYAGDRIVFQNIKYKPEDDEDKIDLTDIISTTPSAPAAPSMTFGPTAILTPRKQILPIAPVNPIGTDGKPVIGVPVPFGHGIATPFARPFGKFGMRGGPGVVVGGPIGTPVRFGSGVF